MNFVNFFNRESHTDIDYCDYPTCVDESDFRPDSEQLRALKVTGQVASVNPVYDSDTNINSITDEMILLRSGKLDKAEIETLRKNIIDADVKQTDARLKDRVEKATAEALGVINSQSDSSK